MKFSREFHFPDYQLFEFRRKIFCAKLDFRFSTAGDKFSRNLGKLPSNVSRTVLLYNKQTRDLTFFFILLIYCSNVTSPLLLDKAKAKTNFYVVIIRKKILMLLLVV